MKVTVITNIPALSGTLWGPNLSQYNSGPASANLISQFKEWVNNVGGEDRETVGEIVFDNVPKGLYELRLTLPYYNHGECFDMIVVMNKFIHLDRDIKLEYKASIIQLPEEV